MSGTTVINKMMNRKSIYTLVCVFFTLITLPGIAFAGTMLLDSFDDLTTDPINLPAANLLVAQLNTTGDKGGSQSTQTTAAIGGTVVAADVAQVCVYYLATLRVVSGQPQRHLQYSP